MRTFLAKWPDGSVTVLTASTSVDLYEALDAEGEPEYAEIFLLPRNFELCFVAIQKAEIGIDDDPGCNRTSPALQKWMFPEDIFGQSYFTPDNRPGRELLHDGVLRKKQYARQKMKQIRKQTLKLKPLQMLGAMKGINERSR